MISYAQNREDVLLQRLFKGHEAGFYVDVGASHPVDASLTKHFYDRGWRGINLEPGRHHADLVRARPRDVNLAIAASDICGRVPFVDYVDEPTRSGLASTLGRPEENNRALLQKKTYEVEARTLASVLGEHCPGPIDFMSIDVEGHEPQVLRGNDWGRFRPRVLVIEATLPNTSIPTHEAFESIVTANGYFFVHFDGLNRFYLREDCRDLAGHFDVPPNYFDHYVTYDQVRAEEKLRVAREECDALRRQNHHTEEALRVLQGEHAAQFLEERRRGDDLRRDLERIYSGTGGRPLAIGLGIARTLSRIARFCRRLTSAPVPPVVPAPEVVAAPSLAELLAGTMGRGSTNVIDIGARGGMESSWYALAPLARLVGFEADAAECERLNVARQDPDLHRYVPQALGRSTGTATLHLTADPACSSLYPPESRLCARYPALRSVDRAGTSEVDVVTLAEWAVQDGLSEAAFIKLDTQGSELDILHGAGALLDTCLGVEVEVEFAAIYEQQPLFPAVHAFLTERGFQLWRLSHPTHYTELNRPRLSRMETMSFDGLQARTIAGSGRLLWANALYFRDQRDVIRGSDGPRRLLILASLLEAAGDPDTAWACLRDHLTSGSGSSRERAALEAVMQRLLAYRRPPA